VRRDAPGPDHGDLHRRLPSVRPAHWQAGLWAELPTAGLHREGLTTPR
jgi:hypothetical protein